VNKNKFYIVYVCRECEGRGDAVKNVKHCRTCSLYKSVGNVDFCKPINGKHQPWCKGDMSHRKGG
jgi:hypothetical protein